MNNDHEVAHGWTLGDLRWLHKQVVRYHPGAVVFVNGDGLLYSMAPNGMGGHWLPSLIRERRARDFVYCKGGGNPIACNKLYEAAVRAGHAYPTSFPAPRLVSVTECDAIVQRFTAELERP